MSDTLPLLVYRSEYVLAAEPLDKQKTYPNPFS